MFNKNTFLKLSWTWFIISITIFIISYFGFNGIIVPIDDMWDRIAFTLQWMTIPVLSILLWFMVTGATRINSQNNDGSTPDQWSTLEIHRRYLLNTLEQFAYFFITQLAFVTIIDSDKLHIIPTLAVLFFVSRMIFWKWYFINSAYRGLGLTMNNVNILILFYVIFHVIFK